MAITITIVASATPAGGQLVKLARQATSFLHLTDEAIIVECNDPEILEQSGLPFIPLLLVNGEVKGGEALPEVGQIVSAITTALVAGE